MGKDQVVQEQPGKGAQDVAPEIIETDLETQNAAENGDVEDLVDESERIDEEEIEELSPEAQISAMQDEISFLKKENEEQFERFQRLSAEHTNYQKRMDAEIQRARKYSIDQFAKAMLDVMESLDQACDIDQTEDTDPAVVAMRDGMELTRKQLLAAFERFSIEEVNPELGAAFDANFHQAMTMRPSEEFPPNHISEVFRKGYRLHDRLLRPAMVIVTSQPTENSE